jgi:hypothetical protein
MIELTLSKNFKIKIWPKPDGGISLAKIAPKARVY